MEFSDLRYLIYFLAFSGGVFALWKVKGPPRAFWWMGWYLLAAGFFQAGGRYMVKAYQSNLEWYNGATVVYYLLLFLIFYHLKPAAKYQRVVLIVFGAWLFPFVVALGPILHGGFAAEAVMVINVTVVSACFVYLYHMLQNPDSRIPPARQGSFVLVLAMLFYFLSSFAFWAASVLVAKASPQLASRLGEFNSVLVLLFYLFVWLALWVQWREHKAE
jgi:hypothetical protein